MGDVLSSTMWLMILSFIAKIKVQIASEITSEFKYLQYFIKKYRI